MRNSSSPQEMVQQAMSGIDPQQKQNILNQAQAYGCPNEILSRIQNMK